MNKEEKTKLIEITEKLQERKAVSKRANEAVDKLKAELKLAEEILEDAVNEAEDAKKRLNKFINPEWTIKLHNGEEL